MFSNSFSRQGRDLGTAATCSLERASSNTLPGVETAMARVGTDGVSNARRADPYMQ
jgi:hypothetical protein